MNRKFLGMLLALLLCLMMVPSAMAEELMIGEGQLKLYSEGAFPNPPELRSARFAARSKTVQQVIYEGMMAQNNEIDIYDYKIMGEDIESLRAALGAVIQDVVNNEPDLFFIDNSYGFSYGKLEGKLIVKVISPRYLYTGEELESEMAAYNSAVNAIVSDARKADTVVGQLMRVNEYFCLNFEYDTRVNDKATRELAVRKPNEFFKQKKGVCQAYTLAFKAVCDRLGVTSTTAPSLAMNHIWNMVNIGSEWYHVDVTWNDPVDDEKLFARHNNFLRSDDGMKSTGHYGWVSNYEATSTEYDDKPWIDLQVPLSVINDKVYYNTLKKDIVIQKDIATLHYYDLVDNSITDLYTYNVNSSWKSGVPCFSNGVRIYLSTGHDVYSVNMNGEDYRLEYIGDQDFIIKNIVVKGDQLSMLVMNEKYTKKVITFEVDMPLTLAVVPAHMTMQPGQKMLLNVDIQPEPDEMPPLTVTISQPPVLSIDGDCVLTAGVPGQAVLTVSYKNRASASAVVTVHREDAAILPAGTKEIRREAFAGMPMEEFVLPEGVERIETGAFAGCDDLLYINLPGSLTYIAPDAFNEESDVTLIVTNGTYAHEYAQASGMNVAVLNPEVTETPAPEATENGDTVTE